VALSSQRWPKKPASHLQGAEPDWLMGKPWPLQGSVELKSAPITWLTVCWSRGRSPGKRMLPAEMGDWNLEASNQSFVFGPKDGAQRGRAGCGCNWGESGASSCDKGAFACENLSSKICSCCWSCELEACGGKRRRRAMKASAPIERIEPSTMSVTLRRCCFWRFRSKRCCLIIMRSLIWS